MHQNGNVGANLHALLHHFPTPLWCQPKSNFLTILGNAHYNSNNERRLQRISAFKNGLGCDSLTFHYPCTSSTYLPNGYPASCADHHNSIFSQAKMHAHSPIPSLLGLSSRKLRKSSKGMGWGCERFQVLVPTVLQKINFSYPKNQSLHLSMLIFLPCHWLNMHRNTTHRLHLRTIKSPQKTWTIVILILE